MALNLHKSKYDSRAVQLLAEYHKKLDEKNLVKKSKKETYKCLETLNNFEQIIQNKNEKSEEITSIVYSNWFDKSLSKLLSFTNNLFSSSLEKNIPSSDTETNFYWIETCTETTDDIFVNKDGFVFLKENLDQYFDPLSNTFEIIDTVSYSKLHEIRSSLRRYYEKIKRNLKSINKNVSKLKKLVGFVKTYSQKLNYKASFENINLTLQRIFVSSGKDEFDLLVFTEKQPAKPINYLFKHLPYETRIKSRYY